ncbi:MAG: glycosyl hydrolase family 17 protein [Saprospiraceae bacterium]
MSTFEKLKLKPGRAICYSGFRGDQRPGILYPKYEQIKEDLLILSPHWDYIRLYDVDTHADLVLEVIHKEKLPLKVYLGAYIDAEMNNFGCPWGGHYSEEQLQANMQSNDAKMNKLVTLCNIHTDTIIAASVGNEACVDWTDHYVHHNRVKYFAEFVKHQISQPVSFCENYVPWLNKLKPLAASLDFISIHTYPVWEYKNIHDALEYTKENYFLVQEAYPDLPVVISEAGWATNSNNKGILAEHVNEENQAIYFQDLMEWTEKEGILTFFFEAFDEPWKGSHDPLEPEKHWGIFKENRTPKKIISSLYFKNI